MTTIRLVSADRIEDLIARSLQSDAILVDGLRHWIAHGGVAIVCRRAHCDLIVDLMAMPGRIVSVPELVDILWSDAPDGGPLRADERARQRMTELHAVARAIGLTIETNGYRGYSARVQP